MSTKETSQRREKHCAKAIAIASGKGGVGKTQIAVNLAVALAQGGQATVLLDTNLGLANVDCILNLRTKANLADVVLGASLLEEILIEGPAGLKVAPAGIGISRLPNLGLMEQMGLISAFTSLKDRPECLVIDSAPGIGSAVLAFCAAADVVLIVICDEPGSIAQSRALIRMLARERGVRRFHIVCNRVNDPEHGRRLFGEFFEDINEANDVSICHAASIPIDPQFAIAAKKGKALVEAHPACPASTALKKLARASEAWRSLGLSSGRQTFFIEYDRDSADSSMYLEAT